MISVQSEKMCDVTYPWFMSFSVSSSHTLTCMVFPSLHQWNISSILRDIQSHLTLCQRFYIIFYEVKMTALVKTEMSKNRMLMKLEV